VPVILVGGVAGRPYLPSIAIDNAAIGCLATEHLLAGGARQVGIITGPLAWSEAQQRRAGWAKTMESHGRDVEDCPVVEGDWTVSSGEQAFHRMLDICPDIDAIHQPLGDAGALAVHQIDDLINKSKQARRAAEAAPEMTLLEPRLIVRASSRGSFGDRSPQWRISRPDRSPRAAGCRLNNPAEARVCMEGRSIGFGDDR
jgi:DNA-binding LacI/PurR family transcriptional regulator